MELRNILAFHFSSIYYPLDPTLKPCLNALGGFLPPQAKLAARCVTPPGGVFPGAPVTDSQFQPRRSKWFAQQAAAQAKRDREAPDQAERDRQALVDAGLSPFPEPIARARCQSPFPEPIARARCQSPFPEPIARARCQSPFPEPIMPAALDPHGRPTSRFSFAGHARLVRDVKDHLPTRRKGRAGTCQCRACLTFPDGNPVQP
jgi:hypothetical protein